MPSFGERFRKWRKARGVTTYEIEKQTGISASNLISIEKNRRPPSDNVLEKLAKVPELGIDHATLLAWRAIEQYGTEPLIKAFQELHPDINLDDFIK